MDKNCLSDHIYIASGGSIDIYSSPLVNKPETKAGVLETPVHEDARGKIERKNINGCKFNIIETKKGFKRSGDLHKNTQFDLILSGKIKLWFYKPYRDIVDQQF